MNFNVLMQVHISDDFANYGADDVLDVFADNAIAGVSVNAST
jgi:hypothetical protein